MRSRSSRASSGLEAPSDSSVGDHGRGGIGGEGSGQRREVLGAVAAQASRVRHLPAAEQLHHRVGHGVDVRAPVAVERGGADAGTGGDAVEGEARQARVGEQPEHGAGRVARRLGAVGQALRGQRHEVADVLVLGRADRRPAPAGTPLPPPHRRRRRPRRRSRSWRRASTNASLATLVMAVAKSGPEVAATWAAPPTESFTASAASRRLLEQGVELRVRTRSWSVGGDGDAAEDRDAEGAADLAGRVVDGRADAGPLGRQRAHDRVGGGRHRQAHAEADEHEHRGDEPVAAVDAREREHEQPDGDQARDRSSRRPWCRTSRRAWRSSGAAIISTAASGSSAAPDCSAL